MTTPRQLAAAMMLFLSGCDTFYAPMDTRTNESFHWSMGYLVTFYEGRGEAHLGFSDKHNLESMGKESEAKRAIQRKTQCVVGDPVTMEVKDGSLGGETLIYSAPVICERGS